MRRLAVGLSLIAISAAADSLPFLPEKHLAAIASEISGESAKRNLEGFSRHHRMRGSRGFHAASEQIVGALKQYGLADAHIESLPADGKIFYGTQRSRPAWNADFAELWEGETRLASWDAAPITLAQDSASADVTAELIDVGSGASEKDYEGKNVAGKLVLAASQPAQWPRWRWRNSGQRGLSATRRTSAPRGGARTRISSAGDISTPSHR